MSTRVTRARARTQQQGNQPAVNPAPAVPLTATVEEVPDGDTTTHAASEGADAPSSPLTVASSSERTERGHTPSTRSTQSLSSVTETDRGGDTPPMGITPIRSEQGSVARDRNAHRQNIANRVADAFREQQEATRRLHVLQRELQNYHDRADDENNNSTPQTRTNRSEPPAGSVRMNIFPQDPDEVLTYAEPDATHSLEAPELATPMRRAADEASSALFRDRDSDETTVTYTRRVAAQERFRAAAKQRFEEGSALRNANALRSWREAEERERYGRGYAPRGRGRGGPPGGPGRGPPSGPHSWDSGRDPNPYDGRGYRGDLRRNEGQRGAAPPGGPPGGDPPSEGDYWDDESDHDDDRDDERGHNPARARANGAGHRRRLPSYLREDNDPFYIPRYGNDPEATDLRTQLEDIRALIRMRLAQGIPEGIGAKNIKSITGPGKYDGRDDADELKTWLKALLWLLSLSKLTGDIDDADGVRVDIVGHHLAGEAQRWFDTVVDDVNGSGRYWNFEQVICAMYKRFIHRSTARRAAEDFHRVKYDEKSGVAGLWDRMVALAAQCPTPPDRYTFNTRFVTALPEKIGIPMFTNRKISVEDSSPQHIRRVALEQEVNNRVVAEFQRQKHHQNPGPRDSAPREPRENRDHRGQNRPQPRQFGGARMNSRAPSAPPYRASGGVDRGASRPPTRATPGPAQSQAQNRTGTRPPRAGSTPAHQAPTRNAAVAPHDRSQVKCYNCGGLGHYASNCPRPEGPKIRAARVVDDREDIPVDNTELESELGPVAHEEQEAPDRDLTSEDPLDDSAQEYWTPEYGYDGAEDYPDGSQYEGGYDAAFEEDQPDDSGDDIVWFGGMRTAVYHGDKSDYEPGDGRMPSEGPVTTPGGDLLLAQDFANLGEIPQGDPNSSATYVRVMLSRTWGPSGNNTTGSDDESLPPLEPNPVVTDTGNAEDTTQGYGPHEAVSPDSLRAQVERLQEQLSASRAEADSLFWARDREAADNDSLRREMDDMQQRHVRAAIDTNYLHREMEKALARERMTIAGHNSLADAARASREQREVLRRGLLARHNPLSTGISEEELEQDDYLEMYADDITLQLALPRLMDELNTPLEDVPRANPQVAEQCPREGEGVSTVSIRAMNTVTVATTPARVVTRARTGHRPLLPRPDQACITAYVTVNGLKAHVLFDSGSTTDSLSPDFVRVANIKPFELEDPVVLQLGCVGSRSRISYGVKTPIAIGKIADELYFDVVNLDRYDAVLGTPFLRKYGASLDFANNGVIIRGELIPALTIKEEETARRRPAAPRRNAPSNGGQSSH